MAEVDPRYHVETAARTITLLNAVADMAGPARLSEIVAKLGWSKPSVYRLVRTLETVGAVRQHDGKGYVLGPAMIWLGQAALRTTRLPEVVHPHLDKLYAQLGETVVLTVLEGDEVIYVDRIEANHVIVERTHLGSRLPAYCTATGQVLLSGLPDEEVRNRLAGRSLVSTGPNTLTSLGAVLERLAEIRRRGYAINDEELAIGHRSAAVPVRDHAGEVIAAISVSVAAGRVTREEVTRFATDSLMPVAVAVSAELGASSDSKLR